MKVSLAFLVLAFAAVAVLAENHGKDHHQVKNKGRSHEHHVKSKGRSHEHYVRGRGRSNEHQVKSKAQHKEDKHHAGKRDNGFPFWPFGSDGGAPFSISWGGNDGEGDNNVNFFSNPIQAITQMVSNFVRQILKMLGISGNAPIELPTFTPINSTDDSTEETAGADEGTTTLSQARAHPADRKSRH